MFYKLSLYIELFLIAFLLASIIAARGPVFWDDGKEAISLPCIEIHIDNISPLQGHDMIEDYYSIIISQGKNFTHPYIRIIKNTPLHPLITPASSDVMMKIIYSTVPIHFLFHSKTKTRK